jgi:hypothetical protein
MAKIGVRGRKAPHPNLSPSERGEGIRDARRADDAPILIPSCDAREKLLKQGVNRVKRQKPAEEAPAHLGLAL